MSGFRTLEMPASIRHDGVQYPSQRSLNRHGAYRIVDHEQQRDRPPERDPERYGETRDPKASQ